MLFISLVIFVANLLLMIAALRRRPPRASIFSALTALVALSAILEANDLSAWRLLWPIELGLLLETLLILERRERVALWAGVGAGLVVVAAGGFEVALVFSAPLLWYAAFRPSRFEALIQRRCVIAPLFLSATLLFELVHGDPNAPPFVLMGFTFADIILGFSMFISTRFQRQIEQLDAVNEALKREIELRRRSEEAEIILTRQLQRAQRMEALGRLAGGVAHDFNNQLSAISAAVEFILIDLPPTAPIREDVESILKAVERSQALTQQLLVFGRKQTSQPRSLKVDKHLRRTLKMVERLCSSHHALSFEARDRGLAVFIDPTQLEQIVMNLSVNALEAMPEGGALRVRAGLVEEGPWGGCVRIQVEDEGVGMDEGTLRQIFDPFFTTKASGTGLGLSMVHGLVEGCGGGLEVSSTLGEGTRFEIYLPCSDVATVSTSKLRRIPTGATEGIKRILFVEDEEAVRRYTARLLRHQGHLVFEAKDAEHALELAAQHPELDLLVTDVFMPGMNGKALAEALSAERPDLVVIFISGYSDKLLGAEGIIPEEIHLLHKPFSIAQLQTKIVEAFIARAIDA